LECESAALTRDIGIALIWAVESLMEALCAALLFAFQALEEKGKALGTVMHDSGPVAAASLTDTRARLHERAKRLAATSLAPSTRKTYEGAFRKYLQWLGGDDPGEESLLLYVAYLETEGKAPSTVRVAVSAVRWALREQGTEVPMGLVRKCLAGVRREAHGQRPRQVKGIKWEQADEVCALAEKDGSVAGLRNAAIIGVMSDALLRVSEASAIDCEDIRLLDDGSGRLVVRRSKTDQAGHGCERYLGPPTVKRIKAWRDAGGINEGPLFRPVHRSGSVLPKGLGVRSIRRIVQACSKAAGIEGRVSGHSLRVGSAQSLAEANASLVAMQRAAGWSSPSMPAYYTREQEAGRGAVACLRYGVTPQV